MNRSLECDEDGYMRAVENGKQIYTGGSFNKNDQAAKDKVVREISRRERGMSVSEIKVGVTYIGDVDYKRGLGSRRTVVEHDKDCGCVTIRNEVGDDPPECYVALANMGVAEFAAWAQREAPAKA